MKNSSSRSRIGTTEDECAWAAGLFEGEGSVTIGRSGHRYTLKVSVTNTDDEIVAFFQARWPASICSPKVVDGNRPCTTWSASAFTAAKFLDDIEPFVQTQRMHRRIGLFRQALVIREGNHGRGPEYQQRLHGLWLEMRRLNHRGTRPFNPGKPFVSGADRRVRGSAHKLAKLSPQQVAEIRRLLHQGEKQRTLATKFGVTQRVVGRIARNESYT